MILILLLLLLLLHFKYNSIKKINVFNFELNLIDFIIITHDYITYPSKLAIRLLLNLWLFTVGGVIKLDFMDKILKNALISTLYDPVVTGLYVEYFVHAERAWTLGVP